MLHDRISKHSAIATADRSAPVLEQERELAAKRFGVAGSQFIIDSMPRALGCNNPIKVMLKTQADGAGRAHPAVERAVRGHEQAHDRLPDGRAFETL